MQVPGGSGAWRKQSYTLNDHSVTTSGHSQRQLKESMVHSYTVSIISTLDSSHNDHVFGVSVPDMQQKPPNAELHANASNTMPTITSTSSHLLHFLFFFLDFFLFRVFLTASSPLPASISAFAVSSLTCPYFCRISFSKSALSSL
jgi:hypothetical protein